MIKKLILSLFILGIFLPVFSFAQPESLTPEKIDFALFYSTSCPHCKEEIKFIDKTLKPKYGQYIDFNFYEIGEPGNQDLFSQYGYYYKADIRGVPVTFIDGEVVYGFGNANTTGKQIMGIVENNLKERGLLEESDIPVNNDGVMNIPVLGEINIKTFSLPILTLVLGLLDGFNPCAMWVLLFLISLLLGIEDRKRMWLLGGIFILTSGIVYFFFMAAWLHFLTFIGMIFAIRLIIGSLAVGIGGKNLWDFWKNRKAEGVVCKVSKNEGTVKTFDKIKNIVKQKSLWWSIVGIIILGFSVNLVELACSAGFPAIFTQVLAMSDLMAWQKYMYMIGYIIFYMLDDLIIFILAMVTLKSKVVGGKYAKYANLVSGLLILVLGILLVLKPEWLMFG